MFAILQKYDFSSKSQPASTSSGRSHGCLRYCKSTIFQANHNFGSSEKLLNMVVCDTAKVRFFKQITTQFYTLFNDLVLFAILQKYDFSSKSQRRAWHRWGNWCCLRYCKSTIFQANHNGTSKGKQTRSVVCDTAKVRFFKQITTPLPQVSWIWCCLRYCKSTIFQANHNKNNVLKISNKLFAILQKYDFSSKSQQLLSYYLPQHVVCDTAKVRFFKQITTVCYVVCLSYALFAILQKYDFSSKSQRNINRERLIFVVCDTAKVRFFKQITTRKPSKQAA